MTLIGGNVDLVMILWRDASSSPAWHRLDDVEFADSDLVCRTVGVLVHQCERITTLAQSWGKDKQDVGGLWCIPTGMILDTKVLKKKVLSR